MARMVDGEAASRSSRSFVAGIREHGEDAALEVAQRADALLEKGDMGGCATWKRVLKAVEEIQRTERSPEEPAH